MSSQILPASAEQQTPTAITSTNHGFADAVAERLDRAVSEGRVWNIHGLVVPQNDKLIIERYFEGNDRKRGTGDLGTVKFVAETLHDLRSCSKSIVALLYGIALQQGQIPVSEAPLLSVCRDVSFPQ